MNKSIIGYFALGLTMFFVANHASAQQGFGTNTPSKAAAIEMKSESKGLLIPRVALTSLTSFGPIKGGATVTVADANSLLVYNTTDNATLKPGYYYWTVTGTSDGTTGTWKRLLATDDNENDWKLLGNAGTNPGTTITPGTHFVGTIDAQDLAFRTNDLERLRITQTGRLDFSNTSGNNTNLFIEGGSEVTGAINSIAIGHHAMEANSDGYSNTVIGNYAFRNGQGGGVLAIGAHVLGESTGIDSSLVIGNYALHKNTGGGFHTVVGNGALGSNLKSENNSAFGRFVLGANTTGSSNSAFGFTALADNTTGSSNVAIGNAAGSYNSTGSFNIAIGSQTDFASQTADGQINIGNILFGTGANATESAHTKGKIGIGITAPTTKLHIKPLSAEEPLRLEGLQAVTTTNRVIVADGDGVLKTILPSELIPSNQKMTTVKAGTNISVTPSTPNPTGNTEYTLSVATATNDALGVVKPGTGLSVATNGTLNVNANNGLTVNETADAVQLGGVLNKATEIDLNSNILALKNLPGGSENDRMVVADASSGALRQIKQAPRFFYMPAVIFDTRNTGTSLVRDLYQDYVNQFTGANYNIAHGADAAGNAASSMPYTGGLIASNGAPGVINTLDRGELYYYISYYDQSVFANLSIDADGKLTYDIISSSTPSSYMNIVFVIQ